MSYFDFATGLKMTNKNSMPYLEDLHEIQRTGSLNDMI